MSVKAELSSTSVELVYDTPLLLLGDFYSRPSIRDSSSSVSALCSTMQHQQFTPMYSNGILVLPNHLSQLTLVEHSMCEIVVMTTNHLGHAITKVLTVSWEGRQAFHCGS